MIQATYHPRTEIESLSDAHIAQPGTNLGRRLRAYVTDAQPITMTIATLFYVSLGLNPTAYAAANEINTRMACTVQRDQLRELSFTLYFFYCCVPALFLFLKWNSKKTPTRQAAEKSESLHTTRWLGIF